MNSTSHVPTGWMKVVQAAKATRVPTSRINALIVSGSIPAIIDSMGYMWVSPQCLRQQKRN